MEEIKHKNSTSDFLSIAKEDGLKSKDSSFAEKEESFTDVIGHEKQKKELRLVLNWFCHSKELKEKGVSIPKGIILFGDPGNGKSLFMKEIVKCADTPVFVFRGEGNNIAAGVIEIFSEARKQGHAIVIFDELDLLIAKDSRVTRALQENLDGVESSDDILVLAATNDIDAIPDPLLRNGRLEKRIYVPYPTGKEALKLFKKYFDAFHLEYPKDFDEEEVLLSLDNISCAGIKAIVNDIVLRNGFYNITTKNIHDSIYNIVDKVKQGENENNLQIAIHEAGHAVVARSFSQYFIVNRLTIDGPSGQFAAKEVNKDFWTYDKVIADIKISMAGILAEKLLCGMASIGEESDLQHARRDAYNLFNINGYSSCWETLPETSVRSRTETFMKRRRMERKIERLLRRCERQTKQYLKRNKEKVLALGKLLYEKKYLKSSQIVSCIG